MARLRRAVAYRRVKRPYTRVSKFRKKGYVRASPNIKIVKFDMGAVKKNFEYQADMISKSSIQIRQEALESARQTCNRWLEKHLGKTGFHFKIRTYPFHILREHSLASGAGADRMSTGMAKAFGKPVGVAAQIKKGQIVFSVKADKQNMNAARTALSKAASKLPCSFSIQTKKSDESFR